MKKLFILFLILFAGICTVQAQDLRDTVEKGIKQSTNLVNGYNWNEGFAVLRGLDTKLGSGNPELHYLVSKQRYTLYRRLNKKNEAQGQLNAMEGYAKASNDKKTKEDLLLAKADFYSSYGDAEASRNCFKQLVQQRAQGADVNGTEKCYKDLIAEAKEKGNTAMGSVIGAMYTAWQDSIAVVRATQELKDLQEQHRLLQEDLDSKQFKINAQWVSIALLAVVAAALGVGLVFILFMLMRNKNITRRLRADLSMANSNNNQKSLFIRNISQQMSPSLNQIALGNPEHIGALRTMLSHIERYMDVENLSDDLLTPVETNVAQFCDEVVTHAKVNLPVAVDAQKLVFPIAKEIMTEMLTIIMQECCIYDGLERLTLSFKKRNPHTGQFQISAIGMKLTEEQKETIFTAFAQVYDLSITDGLSFPTCALMAHKLGGQMTLDPEFAKGTRFLVDIHC